MVLIAGGSGIIQALVAGDLPVAIVSGEPAILARLQGADTVMLGGLINIIDFTIITATEVKKPSDLKGKKLAVSRFGSSTDFVVRYALEKWDSLPIAMLRFSNSAANLRAGGSQKRCRTRTIVGPPADIAARKAGLNELATQEQLNLAYPNTAIVSTFSTIVKDEQLIRRVMKSIVEGIYFFKTQKDASLKSIDAFARLGEADLIDETYRHYKDIVPRVPYPDLESIQNVLKEIAKRDARAKAVKPETFTDTRFLKELEASGFVQKLYR